MEHVSEIDLTLFFQVSSFAVVLALLAYYAFVVYVSFLDSL